MINIKRNLNTVLTDLAEKHLEASIADRLKEIGIDTYQIYQLLPMLEYHTTAAAVGALIIGKKIGSEEAKEFVRLSLENKEEMSKYWITLPWFMDDSIECYLTKNKPEKNSKEIQNLTVLIAASGFNLEELLPLAEYVQQVNEEKQAKYNEKLALINMFNNK